MNGNLDPQTPLMWATVAGTQFTSPNQQLIVVPFSPHGTVYQAAVSNSPYPCGLQMMVQREPWNHVVGFILQFAWSRSGYNLH